MAMSKRTGTVQLGELIATATWRRSNVGGIPCWEICFDVSALTPRQMATLQSVKRRREAMRIRFDDLPTPTSAPCHVIGFDDATKPGMAVLHVAGESS
jgi:hypothetical protein